MRTDGSSRSPAATPGGKAPDAETAPVPRLNIELAGIVAIFWPEKSDLTWTFVT